MDRQRRSVVRVHRTSEKSPYSSFSNSNTASQNSDAEKWDLSGLMAVARRRAPLMAQVSLGTGLLAGGLLLWMTRSSPKEYAGKFQLLVEPVTAEEQQARSSTRAQGAAVPDAQRIDIEQSTLDYESQIRVLQGPRLLDPVVNQVRQRYPDVTYETLAQNLKIVRITTLTSDKKEQGTKLLDVTYQDTDPEKIQFILSQLSKAYLNYSLKERQSTIRQGIQFIDGQLPPLRQKVDLLQKQLLSLRQRYGILDPEQQSKQLAETMGKLDQTKAEHQTEVAEAEAKLDTIAQQLEKGSSQSILGETTYYKTLLEQYQQNAAQIASDSARFKPGHPAMQTLQEKQRNLQTLLDQEAIRVVDKANDAVTVARARQQATIQTQVQLEQQAQRLPEMSRQYNNIQRELLLATDSLNKFAARREALQIDVAQQEIPWELTVPPRLVLDQAGQPKEINSISKVQFLTLIAILSALLGIGVGFLVEAAQDLLHSTDEVKQATRLSLLGVIPHNNSRFPELSMPVTEALRSLMKNLNLLSKHHTPIRSLMISSAESGDGKTTISLHLAMTAARMKQRVLLIDADLRQPKIHQILGLSNHRGLSDLLLKNEEIHPALQSVPGRENLTVLTAGTLRLDPADILTTNRIEPLFQKLQTMFDLVIVDTPPLLGLADSGLIASQCDGSALVVRLGKTSRPKIAAALEELKFVSTTILGVIANDAPETASSPYDSYSSFVVVEG